MQSRQLFLSDNNSSAHPDVISKIASLAGHHAKPYGNDTLTKQAKIKLQEVFNANVSVFFVGNGTAANVLAIKGLTQSFHSVACSASAHIAIDECGAVEQNCGIPLKILPTSQGKIIIDALPDFLDPQHNVHHSQPKVISITQTTETGTLYTIDEIKSICDFAHKHDLYVHMDGARLANAAASLNVSLASMTTECNVDVLSFGGTKNGLLFGDSLVVFNPALANAYAFLCKQSMQLISKMQFISAQFIAYLENDLWLRNALHANKMAQTLYTKLQTQIPEIQFNYLVETNMLFFTIPESWRNDVEKIPLYLLSPHIPQVRVVTSFDTNIESIDTLVQNFKDIKSKHQA